MERNFGILFLLVLASFSAPSVAQEHLPPELTLERAVQTALEKNKDLATARLEVQHADARVQEAYGYAMPAIDFSGRYSRALEKPVFFLPDFSDPGSGRTVPIRIGSDHSIDMTFSARQVLFNSAVFTGVGAAKVYSQAARDIYRAKEIETVTKVRRAFYTALLAAEAADVMRANLRNTEENLRNVQSLARQGIVSEYDLLRASVGVENLRPIVIQTENSYALSLDALKSAVGFEASERFQLVGALTFEPIDEEALTHAEEVGLSSNPSLAAMRHQIEVHRAFKRVYWSDHLPTLAAFGNYQYQLAKNSLNISTGDFQRSSLVGLTLTVNLFQGFQTNARVEQADLEVRKAEEQLTNMEMNLRTLVHSITLQIRQARQRVEAQAKTVEQAERGYKIATSRFLNGSGTQLEVNDAQSALNQARINRMQAIFDYLVAAAELDQAMGQLPRYAIPRTQ
jgi:outer membrane protein TolC